MAVLIWGGRHLLVVARAIVLAEEGILSQAAVFARECGLPAVVGIPRADKTIKTGRQIIVDGSKGTVKIT